MKYKDTLLSWRVVLTLAGGEYLAFKLTTYLFPISNSSGDDAGLATFHFILFSAVFTVLLLQITYRCQLLFKAVMRHRQAGEKVVLAKAVASYRFPYNHLTVLGKDKLQKYVPSNSRSVDSISRSVDSTRRR